MLLCSSCFACLSGHHSRTKDGTDTSGAYCLRDPLVSLLLGEWVASPPLAKARCYEAGEVADLPFIRNKQIEAVKQYSSVLFAACGVYRAT